MAYHKAWKQAGKWINNLLEKDKQGQCYPLHCDGIGNERFPYNEMIIKITTL